MIQRLHSGPRMSQAVVYPATGQMVVLAGQVADDRTADVVGQTKDVLAKIDRLLADAGVDKTAIISATIWLTDISKFDEMNSVWDGWVPAGQTPARACVESKLADPNLKVEIQVHALKP